MTGKNEDSIWEEEIQNKPNPLRSCNLVHAAKLGHLNEVKYWISKNPNILFVNNAFHWQTPLYAAASKGHLKIVQFLWAKSIQFSIKRSKSKRLNFVNLQNDLARIRKKLNTVTLNRYRSIKCGQFWKGMPLLGAAENGHFKVVEYLLLCGFDINIYGGFEEKTALHYSVEGGHNTITKHLIKRGADIFARDRHRHTPLFYAVKKYDKETIELLLNTGDRIYRPDQPPLTEVTNLHNEWHIGRLQIVNYIFALNYFIHTISKRIKKHMELLIILMYMNNSRFCLCNNCTDLYKCVFVL